MEYLLFRFHHIILTQAIKKNLSGKAPSLTNSPWQKEENKMPLLINIVPKLQYWSQEGFTEAERRHLKYIYTCTNNIYLSASRGLPELSVCELPFSSPYPVLPEQLSCQAPYITLVQVGTRVLIRGQISGTMKSLGGCSMCCKLRLNRNGRGKGQWEVPKCSHKHEWSSTLQQRRNGNIWKHLPREEVSVKDFMATLRLYGSAGLE